MNYHKIKKFVQLAKPRIVMMVLVTTTIGFYLGEKGFHSIFTLIMTLLGTALATGGASALNNYLERDVDALMDRTCKRALPQGDIHANHALIYGVTMVLCGVSVLALTANLLSSFLVLLAAFIYVLVYTPMKRISWWNTTIGAVPGAIPPLVGWAAATGSLDAVAWILFLILFTWQHPHFYAIAWMYRDDYRRGGFKMLPVVDPEGKRIFRHILVYTLALIVISVFPVFLGITRMFYLVGVLFLGGLFLAVSLRFLKSKTHQDAKNVFKISLVYLPVYLILVILDLSF
ncbi:protoheme IX farnesyltransferase [PVC group bacterium]|nr:protoheme IX farnesyltransferase [PVC group bacterium]